MPRRLAISVVDLLIAVVILGIIAVIFYPRLRAGRGGGPTATLQAALERLKSAEEAYFAANATYTPNLALLPSAVPTGVMVTFGEATRTGWSAVVAQPPAGSPRCAVFYGTAAPLPPATRVGEIACR